MKDTNDLSVCLEAIKSIPAEKVQTPLMPVETFIQEAQSLYFWSIEDADALGRAGISKENLEELNRRLLACREAQILWVKERQKVNIPQKQWAEQLVQAEELRNKLLHAFRYAFRNDKHLLERLAAIGRGSTNADLIQDLNDLAVLGRGQQPLLEAVSFDLSTLDDAAALASEAPAILAASNSERESGNEPLELRNRAYAYLKELVDEIRYCGKFVFWKDQERLKGYSSDFWRKKNSRRKSPEDR